jgi:hypothetical protein
MTSTNTISRRCKAIDRLLSDYGYRVERSLVIQCGIRGMCGDRIVRHCRDLHDAVEQLIPIIHEPEFAERYRKLKSSW